jgi:Holliday junction DNA helicase RuvB
LGFAVPPGVFGQDPLELFQTDEPDDGAQGEPGGNIAEESGPERIRNSR